MTAPIYTKEYCDSLPKFDRGVSLLCWVYNEEELIEGFLRKANHLLAEAAQDYEIVVVDDASTDHTLEIIYSVQSEIPRIKLVRNPKNMNVGFCIPRAIENATKEYLFWQTIDWSYDLRYLKIFLEFLKSFDIVQGVRRKPVVGVGKQFKPVILLLRLFGIKHLTKRSDTVRKAIVSVVNYMLIRILFSIPVSDFQNVTFYPRKLVKPLRHESNSAFTNPEMLIKSYWRGSSIAEVPISFIPRKLGKGKGASPKAIKRAMRDIFKLWFRWCVLKKRNFYRYGTVARLKPEEWDIDLGYGVAVRKNIEV